MRKRYDPAVGDESAKIAAAYDHGVWVEPVEPIDHDVLHEELQGTECTKVDQVLCSVQRQVNERSVRQIANGVCFLAKVIEIPDDTRKRRQRRLNRRGGRLNG